jgi:hypothetical protein
MPGRFFSDTKDRRTQNESKIESHCPPSNIITPQRQPLSDHSLFIPGSQLTIRYAIIIIIIIIISRSFSNTAQFAAIDGLQFQPCRVR